MFIVKGVDKQMQTTSARPADGIERIVEIYGNMLFRICLVTLNNEADAEDAVQDTLIKYLCKAPSFRDMEHEKAWLIRVAVNQCRDVARSKRKRTEYELENMKTRYADRENGQIIHALMTLPDKFKTVLTLHYVEEYKVEEIAKMIGKSTSAVKMRLQKGRKLLEEAYRKEFM